MTRDLKPISFIDRTKVVKTPSQVSPQKTALRTKFHVQIGKKDPERRKLFTEEEEEKEQGVGQLFPDAVSFCTNDHCQL